MVDDIKLYRSDGSYGDYYAGFPDVLPEAAVDPVFEVNGEVPVNENPREGETDPVFL